MPYDTNVDDGISVVQLIVAEVVVIFETLTAEIAGG